MNTREHLPLDFVAYPDYGAPKDEWLAARMQGIGSSDAAAILGFDRFNSPMSCWLDKVGESEPKEETAVMHFGKRLEGVVAQEYEEETGLICAHPTAMFQHAEVDCALASPDRFVYGDDAVVPMSCLEIKTGRNESVWEDGPPPGYVIQNIWQQAVTGIHDGALAVLLNGREFRSWEVPWDEGLAELALERAVEFWKLVESKVPPAPDGHEATTAALKRMYRDVEPGAIVELDSEVLDAVAAYKDTADRLKMVKANHEEAANLLRLALGEAEIGTYDGDVVVKWTRVESRRVDLDALRAQHPDLAETFTKVTSSRRMTVK